MKQSIQSFLYLLIVMLGIADIQAQSSTTSLTLSTLATTEVDSLTSLRLSSNSFEQQSPELLHYSSIDSSKDLPLQISYWSAYTQSQVVDSIRFDTHPQAWKPKSSRALLWSIIPGGGQIYNRKYWKVPIVWGAFLTTFYAIRFNQRMYTDYHNAYRDIMSSDPTVNTAWLAFTPSGTKPEDYPQYERLKSTLKRGNDYYRRYRDLSIVAGILIYALSALDAYVDAELFTFDISPDLTMQVRPQLNPVYSTPYSPSNPQIGLLCSLSF